MGALGASQIGMTGPGSAPAWPKNLCPLNTAVSEDTAQDPALISRGEPPVQIPGRAYRRHSDLDPMKGTPRSIEEPPGWPVVKSPLCKNCTEATPADTPTSARPGSEAMARAGRGFLHPEVLPSRPLEVLLAGLHCLPQNRTGSLQNGPTHIASGFHTRGAGVVTPRGWQRAEGAWCLVF